MQIDLDPSLEVGAIPLVVDLDGTLVRTDLLYESYLNTVSLGLAHHLRCLNALRQGKASLKQVLAHARDLDYAGLPYDEAVLEVIRAARFEGRPVYLATASDQLHAAAVAAHLGLFDGVFASEGTTNLSGAAKARLLVERFGRRGFDYIGNGAADLAIWAEARKAYAIRTGRGVERALGRMGIPVERLADLSPSVAVWLKAMRVHQWAKNTLIFVPLLTAHAFSVAPALAAMLAFAAFCLCASGVYILNDLVDLQSDRSHPTKQRRPLASGTIPIARAVVAVPVLFGLALACALSVSMPFTAVLAGYVALTTAYSIHLKRKLLVDVVVLATLYTVRVVAGAVAIDVVVSQWLLAFSMFIFLALALIKRHAELTLRIEKGLPDPGNRNYKLTDISVVAALAAASGFNAVTIFSLYIASPVVQDAYQRPGLLWLLCPILVYWIARIIMLAHRREIDDDPVLFAIRDRNSRLAVLLMIAIVLAAV